MVYNFDECHEEPTGPLTGGEERMDIMDVNAIG